MQKKLHRNIVITYFSIFRFIAVAVNGKEVLNHHRKLAPLYEERRWEQKLEVLYIFPVDFIDLT